MPAVHGERVKNIKMRVGVDCYEGDLVTVPTLSMKCLIVARIISLKVRKPKNKILPISSIVFI